MKIYFSYSARGVCTFGANYQQIESSLLSLDHQIVKSAESNPTTFSSPKSINWATLASTSLTALRQCEAVIFEISSSSCTIGFLLHAALSLGKPVIALHVQESPPTFIRGLSDENLQVLEYNLHNLSDTLREAFAYIRSELAVRFNFHIPSPLFHYLNWVTKDLKIPKSVYLRQLIEQDMTAKGLYDRDDIPA